jgi:hypothetical protein
MTCDVKVPLWVGRWAKLRLVEIALARQRFDDARRVLARLAGEVDNAEFQQRLNAVRAELP